MLTVTCPSNNIPERKYAISALFNELLGCDLTEESIRFDKSFKDYHIHAGGKEIIVEDHFFNEYPEALSYLESSHIPNRLDYLHARGLVVPIVYGRDRYIEEQDRVTIGLDVFASSFFMLTRWEESLLGREQKGDCDETQLFAVKMGIYQRPIVHEYEELLRLLLTEAGIPLKERKYEVVLSHDVDGFETPSFKKIVKDCIRQTIYGAPKNTILNLTWKEELKYKRAFPTAYSQFELYTRLSKQFDVPEWFYFKVCAPGEVESTYSYNSKQTIDIVNRLKELQSPRVEMGFHPSQSTLGNEIQWKKESSRIESLLGFVPTIGRNHHLLYNYEMLRNWESEANRTSTGFLHISNSLFHNKIGFRSGIGVGYTLFDIYHRRPMQLVEHPCQIMDTVIRYHSKDSTSEEIWDEIQTVVTYAKKYQCELVLTWHIYIRAQKLIRRYFDWCERVIRYANEQ